MLNIINDQGIRNESELISFLSLEALLSEIPEPNQKLFITLTNQEDIRKLIPFLSRIAMVRLHFPQAGDGRGFTQAKLLRYHGYEGIIRGYGMLIPDQYRFARFCGIDEIEIGESLALRQDLGVWNRKLNNIEILNNYQQRLRAAI